LRREEIKIRFVGWKRPLSRNLRNNAVARWTGKIATVDNLDQRETSRKFFLRAQGVARIGVSSQRACWSIVGRVTGLAAATRILGFSVRQPVEPRIGGDTNPLFAMLRAGAFQKNLGRNRPSSPDLRRTRNKAHWTAGSCAFQELVSQFKYS
jgi:hypothetical protein